MLSETLAGNTSLNGHVAHIVAAEDNGPRANPSIPRPERQAYTNLLLLCFKHHQQVDDHPDEFPVERLQEMKAQHEAWVAQQLEMRDHAAEVAQEIYNGIIESAVENLDFRQWSTWSTFLTISHPRIIWDMEQGFHTFIQDVISAAWSGQHHEFEAAARVLADEIAGLETLFAQHGFLIQGGDIEIKRVQPHLLRPDQVETELTQHDSVVRAITEHIFQATKAANWFADIVRRDFNPSFMQHKIRIEEDRPIEFTDTEKHAIMARYSERTQ